MSPARATANPARLTLAIAALFALAACSPESAVGPSTTPAASRAAAARELPFHGTLEAHEDTRFEPAPPPDATVMFVEMHGTGTATLLGRYTLDYVATVQQPSGVGVGTMTYTAANGDVLWATYTALGIITNGVADVREEATITGGTGRFAGATGSFVNTRAVQVATGNSTGSFNGTITLAH